MVTVLPSAVSAAARRGKPTRALPVSIPMPMPSGSGPVGGSAGGMAYFREDACSGAQGLRDFLRRGLPGHITASPAYSSTLPRWACDAVDQGKGMQQRRAILRRKVFAVGE